MIRIYYIISMNETLNRMVTMFNLNLGILWKMYSNKKVNAIIDKYVELVGHEPRVDVVTLNGAQYQTMLDTIASI